MEHRTEPNDCFLITGAMGCIGAWVVRNLVNEGISVVAFDLISDSRRLKLIMPPDTLSKVTFVNGDITDLSALEQVLQMYAITHIIHLAALQMPSVKADPQLGARINVVGTVNVFETVARHNEQIKRIVYASSVAVYDTDAGAESMVVQHDTAEHPNSLYGVFKQANEGTARIYWQDKHVSSIGLRPATVYGPGRDQGFTSAPTRAMCAAAVGKPFHIPYGGRGEFQYVDDVAKIFIACSYAPFEGAETFNLHGRVLHMRELVAEIESVVPTVRGMITFSEPGFPSPEQFDAGSLTRLIGSLPCTPLRAGVTATISLLRQQVSSGNLSANELLY